MSSWNQLDNIGNKTPVLRRLAAFNLCLIVITSTWKFEVVSLNNSVFGLNYIPLILNRANILQFLYSQGIEALMD